MDSSPRTALDMSAYPNGQATRPEPLAAAGPVRQLLQVVLSGSRQPPAVRSGSASRCATRSTPAVAQRLLPGPSRPAPPRRRSASLGRRGQRGRQPLDGADAAHRGRR
ncbi:hypothetical protein ACRAWF_36320 [Streptomyces sp. L7]